MNFREKESLDKGVGKRYWYESSINYLRLMKNRSFEKVRFYGRFYGRKDLCEFLINIYSKVISKFWDFKRILKI